MVRHTTEKTDFGKIKHLYDFASCSVKKVYIDPNKYISPYGPVKDKTSHYLVIQGQATIVYDMYSTYKTKGSMIEINYPTIIENNSKSRLILLNVITK